MDIEVLQNYAFAFQISEVQKFARDIHTTCCTTRAKISYDGVNESKSTSISLDIYSICFEGCCLWYPVIIVKPFDVGYKRDKYEYLKDFIQEIK